MESFFRIEPGPTVCSSVHTEPNHGVGVHVLSFLVPLTIIRLCCADCSVSFALVVHYARVAVLYLGLSWTRVLSASFQVLSPTVISYP